MTEVGAAWQQEKPTVSATHPTVSSKCSKPPALLTQVSFVLSLDFESVNRLDSGRKHAAGLLADTIPGASLIAVPGSGHMIPMEAPERFNEILAEFFGSVDG